MYLKYGGTKKHLNAFETRTFPTFWSHQKVIGPFDDGDFHMKMCLFWDCTGNTRFCHLSWFFRESLNFYLPCSWIHHWTSSHYSCISILGIMYWQAVYLQILTEYTVATTKITTFYAIFCIWQSPEHTHLTQFQSCDIHHPLFLNLWCVSNALHQVIACPPFKAPPLFQCPIF